MLCCIPALINIYFSDILHSWHSCATECEIKQSIFSNIWSMMSTFSMLLRNRQRQIKLNKRSKAEHFQVVLCVLQHLTSPAGQRSLVWPVFFFFFLLFFFYSSYISIRAHFCFSTQTVTQNVTLVNNLTFSWWVAMLGINSGLCIVRETH